MKQALLNNLSAFIVHLVLIVFILSLLFVLKKSGLASELFPSAHILSFLTLVLYFLAGYLFSGTLFARYNNAFMTLLSVSGIFFIGVCIWFFCEANRGAWFAQLDYVLYVPFSSSLNELFKISDYSSINLVYSVIPTVLIGSGIYSRT